ncbi:MAG TPA: TonB family protein [Pyrinomonadaceae bacterium]
MNVNCTNCGAMLVGGETVCPVCQQPVAPTEGRAGWQQPGAPTSSRWQQPVGQPQYGPPPGEGNAGMTGVWLGLIGLLLVLVLAGGGLFIYLNIREKTINKVDKEVDELGQLTEPASDSSDSNINSTSTVPPPPRNSNSSRAPISGGVLNGKAISLPKPAYPAIARAARASGTVTVQVTVDESGKVTEARAVSGHPLLQQAAVQAARQARFSPTQLAGKPVKVTGTLSYKFELE